MSIGADRYLPWDRRVTVATVRPQGDKLEPAREQMRRCLTELNEKKLRSLSAGALYRLLVLSHAFESEIADPRLRALAHDLLPPELGAQL